MSILKVLLVYISHNTLTQYLQLSFGNEAILMVNNETFIISLVLHGDIVDYDEFFGFVYLYVIWQVSIVE